jgi:hypothetical protein
MNIGLQGQVGMTESLFDELQRKLVPLWESIGRTDPGGALEEENTVVVIPSLSVDFRMSGSELQAYEERFMFMLGSRGFLGATAIGNSPENAQAIYRRLIEVPDAKAERALAN